jgi:DHA1 family bicyclomycin/chloramphenicol resistance-like MFS transporter
VSFFINPKFEPDGKEMQMKQAVAAIQSPTRLRRLWIAAVLGSLCAFGPLSIDMYLPALPNLAVDLQTTTSLAQLSLTACLLGLALGQVVVGPISDARGRRRPLLLALIIYVLASILCALAPTITILVLSRFIQGVGGAAGIVIARAVVRDLYAGTELTKFFSLLMLVNGAAPILAPIAGGQLMKVVPWEGVFIVLCAIGLVMFLVVWFGLPETLPIDRRSTGKLKDTLITYRTLLTTHSFMGYAWSQGLVMAAMFGYIAGSPFVLQELYGVSPQGFSLVFAMNGVGIILAAQITGRLVGRISETGLLLTGLTMAAIAGITLLGAIVSGAGLVFVVIPLFFVVSSVGVVSTTSFSLAMQNQAKSAGSAAGLLGLLPFIFGAIVAPLVGLGGSGTAVPMGIVIATADLGAIMCYWLLVGRVKA